MTSFTRTFNVHALVAWCHEHADTAIQSLLKKWALPGEPFSDERQLRVGIRDGYVNFYVKGQSVAKLDMPRGLPRLSVHRSYVDGHKRRPRAEGAAHPQTYVAFVTNDLSDRSSSKHVSQWIEVAETYASAEKGFVDDLVAANPGVLDLEMALPADTSPGSSRVAPRMDLVIAQGDAARPAITFWEAKCAINTELRSNSTPSVIGHILKYETWIHQGQRLAEVQAAYRTTAAILVDLVERFRPDAADLETVKRWRSLAKLDAPEVIARPGLVIGNYWPNGYREEIASGRMAQSAASFARNRHREAIEAHGIVVHEVGPDHLGPALPLLGQANAH